MEGLYLKFEPERSSFKLDFNSRLLFLGSCFSDEIANRAMDSGLHAESNPFGVIFHPIPLARFIRDCFTEKVTERTFQQDGCFYSWDASRKIVSGNEIELLAQLNEIRKNWSKLISEASVLFVTFGTSWSYRLQNGEIVSNCHKYPQANFTKRLTESEEIEAEWSETLQLLKRINPLLEVVFTVSPVRHIRDGLIENNQSKSILINAVRKLRSSFNVHYFPSYEIIIDQLRDYRFFKEDRIHPSDEAISIIWKVFLTTYVSSEAKVAIKEIESFKRFLAHIPKSADQQDHGLKIESRLKELKEKYPEADL